MKFSTKFNHLKQVFETLHGPRGCLWDKKQTHKTLINDLREEVEELIEAIERNDYRHMQEELGDVLLHVMFHSQIAAKKKKFSVEDVIDSLIKKLKRRHPHVFGNVKVRTTREIIANWERIKSKEKKGGSNV